MSSTPKVSIIIPNYNHAPFLARRLESVLAQSYTDYEIIILDDCSSDNSREIIEQYRNNPKVSEIVYNSSNSGSPFIQWNKGVKLARGKYIWIAESDDQADTTFLAKTVETLNSNPDVGIVKTLTRMIDENDNQLDIWEYQRERNWSNSFIIDGREDCLLQMKYRTSFPNASGIVFRKDIYVSSGYACESFKYSGDWMTWIQMLKSCKLAHIAEPLNFMREMHNNSARIQYLDKNRGRYHREFFIVMKYIVKNFKPSAGYTLETFKKPLQVYIKELCNIAKQLIKFKDFVSITYIISSTSFLLAFYLFLATIKRTFDIIIMKLKKLVRLQNIFGL